MSALVKSDDILSTIKNGIKKEQDRLARLDEIYRDIDPCKKSKERDRLAKEIQGRISILQNLYSEAEIQMGIKQRERPSKPTRSKPGRPGRPGPTGSAGKKGGQCCDDCK